MAAKPRPNAEETPTGFYTADSYGAEDSVGFLIASLRTRIFKAVDIEMAKFGITSAQWPILRAVANGSTPTPAELCRLLNYDTGSMTRMLNRLERKGVIERAASASDRRVVHVRLTPAGRKLFPKLREVVVRVLNHLTSGMSAEEIHQMNDRLRTMRDNLRAIYGADL